MCCTCRVYSFRRSVGVFVVLLASCCPAAFSLTPAPRAIGFAGRLTAPNGTPKPDGAYSLTLALYAAESGGSPLWSESRTVQVTNGLFSAALGSVTPFPPTLDFSEAYFVGVKVGEDPEMLPRLPLQGAPYTLFAHDVAYGSVDALRLKVDTDSLAAVSGGVMSARQIFETSEIGLRFYSDPTEVSSPWQSFTPRETISAHRLVVFLSYAPLAAQGSYRVNVYEGEGTSGRLVGYSYATVGYGDQEMVLGFNPPLLLKALTTYTWQIPGSPPTDLYSSSYNLLPDGRASTDANADFAFRIYGYTGSVLVRGPLQVGANLTMDAGWEFQAPPMGLTTEGRILNFDYNFRHADKTSSQPGAALRIDGRSPEYPLFQFLGRAPHSASEPILVSITHDGNAGIGTSSPSNGLVVAKTGGSGASLENGVHLGIDTAGNSHIELVGGAPYIDFNNDNQSDNKARLVLTGNNRLQASVPEFFVDGTLMKKAGSFRIDHPLDPENRYLSHSFVESPDMMNVYNGNVTLGADGRAEVTLPDWFEALNRDFRYQLTPIGAPGPDLFIESEIHGNRFSIAGGRPGLRVSWQVTGVRHDTYAEQHRIPVEEDKQAGEP